jgi:hypothetical protein
MMAGDLDPAELAPPPGLSPVADILETRLAADALPAHDWPEPRDAQTPEMEGLATIARANLAADTWEKESRPLTPDEAAQDYDIAKEEATRLGFATVADYLNATRPLGVHQEADPAPFPEPEDRGAAVLSALGDVEYVADFIRPGRIVTWAAEEGSGKSYAVGGELAIRVAIAGGSFAGTWPVLRTGPVLYLSEMHADDDYGREETVLSSLDLERSALVGRYFRLPLMTAAGGRPALMVPEWRAWVTGWLRDAGALLLIVDTATGATQVDPWGPEIQAVYAALRVMLAEYPDLAIVLLIHLKKPQGRGERRISDVLGEWGRWCDVVVIQENDGGGLARARLTVRKRVRHERRIIVTKADGLLIDPQDLDEERTTKVPAAAVLEAIAAEPGIGLAALGKRLEVSKDTAGNYVRTLEKAGSVVTRKVGPKRSVAVYPSEPTAEPPNTTEQARFGGTSAVEGHRNKSGPPNAEPTYIGSAVRSSVVTAWPDFEDPAPVDAPVDSPEPGASIECADYHAHQSRHRFTTEGWTCDACRPGSAPALS